MKNLWNDAEAETLVADYAAKGVGRDLALRVYTTRLLGGEPRLVLHGGGNTSVKTKATDLVGDDMGRALRQGQRLGHGRHRAAGPAGGEARRRCSRPRKLDRAVGRGHGRAAARQPASTRRRPTRRSRRCCTPSCRTNSSTTRIRPPCLASSTRTDSETICREVLRRRLGFVPYIMPGFDLAKAAAEVFEQDTSVEGLILDKHGIFTFGETAKEAYDAHDRLRHRGGGLCRDERQGAAPRRPRCRRRSPAPAEIASTLRGAVAVAKGEGRFDRMISDFRTSPRSSTSCRSREARATWRARGVSTPDLSIRIKTGPMVLPAPDGRQARRLRGRSIRTSSRGHSRRTTAPISRRTTRATTSSAPCSTRCRA